MNYTEEESEYKNMENHFNTSANYLNKIINNIKNENCEDITILNKIQRNNNINSKKLSKIIKGKEKKIKLFYELITALVRTIDLKYNKLINLNSYMIQLDDIYKKLENKLYILYPSYKNNRKYRIFMEYFTPVGDPVKDAYYSIYKYMLINDIIKDKIKINNNSTRDKTRQLFLKEIEINDKIMKLKELIPGPLCDEANIILNSFLLE
jgi:hypothetical protein